MAGRSAKGAADAVRDFHRGAGSLPRSETTVDAIARSGGTPLVVAEKTRVLGVIQSQGRCEGGLKRPL